MRFDIVTIFPAMIEPALAVGVVGRAIERGTLALKVHDLRNFTTDRHRVVDDTPYGGGPGMVLKPEPLFRALDAIDAERWGADGEISHERRRRARVLLTSPQGTRLTHAVAERLSREPHVVLICGRYEGVDERVRSRVDEEVSIGDYVLSGGELAALVIVDAVARLVPGVVGDEQSLDDESFTRGLLDFPHYTRPARLNSRDDVDDSLMGVPEVLVSGNHAEIRRWRKREALARTLARRPELLADATLDDEEQQILRELMAQRGKTE
jgi:tRNA (guanine37-N1)-methyltransferase